MIILSGLLFLGLSVWQLSALITDWDKLKPDWRTSKRKSPIVSRPNETHTEGLLHLRIVKNKVLNETLLGIGLACLVVFVVSISSAFAQVTFKDKQECEAHYNAASTTLFQYVDRSQQCEESLWEALCDETIEWENGQRGGLWKPVSESTGRPVVLLPQSYQDKSMIVLSPTGKPVASGKFRSLTNPDRATFDISTSNLPYESRVMIMNADKVECRYVLDPSKRYD